MKTTSIAFSISMISSFGIGVGSYAIEQVYGRDKEWNWTNAMINGIVVTGESYINFLLGAGFGATGLWKSLNMGQMKRNYTLMRIGYGCVKSAFLSFAMFLAENGTQIVTRFAFKYAYTYAWKYLRGKLNEEVY